MTAPGTTDEVREQTPLELPPLVDSLVLAEMRNRSRAAMFGVEREQVSIEHYEIRCELGRGGMGIVYEAWDSKLDRKVAIKVLNPSRARDPARLAREAKAMAKLAHPNVVRVHQIGEVDHKTFIVMEFVKGQTLRAWLAKAPRSRDQILVAFQSAGKGLAAAHAAGLVHRDFKPDNVLIDDDGRVLVTDFGLAFSDGAAAPSRHEGHTVAQSVLTATGAILGSPAYMAPEQFTSARVSAKADQFSFCVSLWEALWKQRPFQGASLAMLEAAVKSGDFTEPECPRTPTWLARVIERGLADDPEQRWPSIDELLAALKRDPVKRRRRAGLAFVLGGALIAAGSWTFDQVQNLEDEAREAKEAVVVGDIEWRDTVAAREAEQVMNLIELGKTTEALLRASEAVARYGPSWTPPPPHAALVALERALVATTLADDPDVYVIAGHEQISDLQYSPDGTRLATTGDNGVKVWDLASGDILYQHDPNIDTEMSGAIAFSPTGDYLATASGRSPRIWDAATGRLLASLYGHDSVVDAISFSRDGEFVATVDQSGTVKTWRVHLEPEADIVSTIKPWSTTNVPGRGARLLTHSPDLSSVALVADRKVKLWDLSRDASNRDLAVSIWPVDSAHWSPDGTIAIVGRNRVELWDAGLGLRLAVVPKAKLARQIATVSLAPDATQLVTASADGHLRVWQSSSGTLVADLPAESNLDRQRSTATPLLVHSPDGQYYASSVGRRVRVWTRSGELVRILPHLKGVRALTFSPDSQHLATASEAGVAAVWDLGEKAPLVVLEHRLAYRHADDGSRPSSPAELLSLACARLEKLDIDHSEAICNAVG